MPRYLNPPGVPRPASKYSQGVAIGATFKRVLVSGQIGLDANGKLAEGTAAQMAQAFDNVLAIIAAAGLGPADIVKLSCYVTAPGAVTTWRKLREDRLGAHRPAATFLQVAGLADPAWLVEIEAEAVQEGPTGR